MHKHHLTRKCLDWVLPRYKKYKQDRHSEEPDVIEKSIRALLRQSRYIFLTSYFTGSTKQQPYCSTRYVQPIVEWNNHTFSIWIGTHARSRKIAEIKSNPMVTLAAGQESDGANLIIYGHATLHADNAKRRKYWKSSWKLFFPEGPVSDDAVLVCVKPLKLELMDFKRNIIPEPFGLKPLTLHERDQRWVA